MAARAGHVTVVATVSPGPSDGTIERGDHSTRHEPETSLRCYELCTVSEPMVPTTRWLVTAAVASDPLEESAPWL